MDLRDLADLIWFGLLLLGLGAVAFAFLIYAPYVAWRSYRERTRDGHTAR